ncbi:MAG: TIGR04282 family arsenosugar biosynthesis glycosyltransferase [Myxococcales bacterium]|nr:TIGR04282 family arsenosugar biosynthesis glycosyltransferase [Myxococcota bacterium]MDW8280149.1 TIGR04282 family arsenosugar biosynthesis glycosyltransferase [Myxococcales bacterium]
MAAISIGASADARQDGPVLLVLARPPVVGQVKTRLLQPGPWGRPLRPDEATALHLAFVRDVCCAGARSGIAARHLLGAGPDPTGQLAQVAAETGFELGQQVQGDLGQRMQAALEGPLRAGAEAVVLIGSDSPTLPPAHLAEAAEVLHSGHVDLVLGPALDGGFWCIGARRPCPELLAPGMAWGTKEVLPAMLGRLAQLAEAGLRSYLLPFWYDVDTPDDLRLLCGELRLRPEAAPATRSVLEELALL